MARKFWVERANCQRLACIFAIAVIFTCSGSGQMSVTTPGSVLPADTSNDTIRTADYYYMQLPGDTSGD